MSPRLFLPLASAGCIALGAAAALAEPPQPSSPAPPAPVTAPPPAERPPWMRRPPQSPALYPGWRLEEAPRPGETAEPQWYGWQSLMGIIPSHGIALLGLTDNDLIPLIYLGAAGHALTSPIVHWAHGNVGTGFLSLGVNIGAPLLGGMIAFETRSTGLLFTMGFLTIVGWPVVDTLLLSYEDAPKSKDKSARLIDSFAVVPMLDGDRKGLSLVGQF
ncbi:hypothetical protein [Polyangium spumosum]|uniref:Uncharacterized protein n=1 Tax=Polyangium spumosum TaxID=889282 RepID=A0A6N7PNY5_9BACT|nr:hypothetical protein [Polyangium spumosum]MRG91865.1 hypothetical protein [Polyangium spumosum]